jgi:hypothetical protein
MNNNDIAVDISGWYLTGGGIKFQTLPGIYIASFW